MIRRFLVALAVCLAFASLSTAGEWVIPGVANVPGANGTRFLSDLTITNLSDSAATLSFRFIPSAGTAPSPRTESVLAGETVSFHNPLERLFGLTQGGGALVAASDATFAIRATTFNDAASGTYGLALPVVESSQLLRAGDRGESYWASQSIDFTSGYRTNIGVVFPDLGGGAATIHLYDATGQLIASRSVSSSSATFIQEPLTAYSSQEIGVGRVAMTVTRGAAAAYTSVVDNVTGDGSLFPLERAPVGATDIVLSGAARANGASDTFFRTDVRIANPSSQAAIVEARFLRPGADNRAPTGRSLTLAAGEVREVIDLLGSLFGEPTGTTGAVRFTSGQPIAVLGRTSNLGAGRGTFGAQQFSVRYSDFITGGSLTLHGIRQNSSYRTNVGFSSGSSGASYAIELYSPMGSRIADTTRSLLSYSWEQANVATIFPGVTIPDDSRLVITPTEGSIHAYASTVDQLSGDAVVSQAYAAPRSIGLYGPGSGGRGGPAPGLQRFPGVSGRDYIVYVPATYRQSEPARLLFALGGQGMPADLTLNYQWREVADAENLIVITLTPSSSGPGYTGAYDYPEFETIEKARTEVLRLYNVATERMYMWGFSAGAHVSYMLGLSASWSTQLAAMAIQAGAIEAAATRISPPAWPPQSGARRLPIYISCGTLDTAGGGGGLIGALRRNRDMLLGAGYPVQTREVEGQGHTYTATDVEMAWSFLEAQKR